MILKKKWYIIFLFFIVGILYWDIFQFDFLRYWDDNIYILDRFALQQIARGEWWKGITTLLNPFRALHGYFWEYFPIRDLTYAVDAALGGFHPTFFHLTNLLFHLGSTFFVWLLAQKFGLTEKGAFFAALLFAIHPLAVEPVVWISARKDLSYTFFILLALLSFHPLVDGDSSISSFRQWFLVYLFSVAAALSKGAGAIVIFLLIWIILLRVQRKYWKAFFLRLLPLLLFSVVWLGFIIQIGKQNHVIILGANFSIANLPLMKRLFVVVGEPIWALFFYFFPVKLLPTAIYQFHEDLWFASLQTWLMLLGLVVVFVGFYRKKISLSFLLFSGLAALSVIPHSGIVPVHQYHSSRFYYLFLVFFSIFIIYLYEKYLIRWKMLPLLLLLTFFFMQSYRYKNVWKDDRALWSYTLEVDPYNVEANKVFAMWAMEKQQFKKAKNYFARILKKYPSYSYIRVQMALADYFIAIQTPNMPYKERKRLIDQSEAIFRKYLKSSSKGVALWAHIGLGYIAQLYKKYGVAEHLFKETLKYREKDFISLLSLGNLYWETHRYREAYRLFYRYAAYFRGDVQYQRWLKEHPLPRR